MIEPVETQRPGQSGFRLVVEGHEAAEGPGDVLDGEKGRHGGGTILSRNPSGAK